MARCVVLFGQSPAERPQLTGTPERTLYRQVAREDGRHSPAEVHGWVHGRQVTPEDR